MLRHRIFIKGFGLMALVAGAITTPKSAEASSEPLLRMQGAAERELPERGRHIAQLSAASTSTRLTIEEAVRLAYAQSPQLQAQKAKVQQAEGRLVGAEMLLPFNPVVGGYAAQREGRGRKTIDWGVNLSQKVQIFGQRGDRIDVATSNLAEARSRLLRVERLLSARVQLAFISTLRTRKLVEIETTNVALATELFQVAEKKFSAGSTTRLDVNLASGELGHAERGLYFAQAEYAMARAILAETMGTSPSAPPEPDGDFVIPTDEAPSLASLLQTAQENRADLSAMNISVRTAERRIALARSRAVPNITLSGYVNSEEQTDIIIGGGLSIPIPLFNRNQGKIAQARALSTRAEAQAHTVRLQVEQEVMSMRARFQAAKGAAQALQKRVMGTLEQNLELLGKSFRAGKIGLTDVLVIRRNLLESRAEYVDAQASAQKAYVELSLAAGTVNFKHSSEETLP